MTVLNVVALALLAVIGTGAYRVFLYITAQLSGNIRKAYAERTAFVIVAMIAAAMISPFLLPSSLPLEIAVWILYMAFAGIGAWHVWEWILTFRNANSSRP